MIRRFGILAFVAALIGLALALLVTRLGPYDEHLRDPSLTTQLPDREVPAGAPVQDSDVDVEIALDEPEDEVPSSPVQQTENTPSADTALEEIDPFFVTEDDYVSVTILWSGQYARNGDNWVSHLESELTRNDDELNSRDLEELAVSAVLLDPAYKYDPPLTAEQLTPTCRNLVCKVQIPSGVSLIKNYSAIRLVAGSRLNTQDQVMFTHGFGYHLVLKRLNENTTTHYFLANGYELQRDSQFSADKNRGD